MSVISAAAFRAQMDRWGVDYVQHSRRGRCLGRAVDWSDHEARRGRDCARRGWDAHGIAIHHSGGPTSWEFVWDGRSDVPGPLYTVLIYPDGKAHLTGWRITNNVGRCDATVRNRVLAGNMPTSGGNVSPGGDDYSAANSEFYGISYRGTKPNAAQRRTALLICAAICSAHGSDWDGGSVAGHKELTRRKPDPEGENMSTFRANLNKLLAAGPRGSATPEEDDMPFRDWPKVDQNALADSVVDRLMSHRVPWPSQWVIDRWNSREDGYTVGHYLAQGYALSRSSHEAAAPVRWEDGELRTIPHTLSWLQRAVHTVLSAQEGLDTPAILARLDEIAAADAARDQAILAAVESIESGDADSALARLRDVLDAALPDA